VSKSDWPTQKKWREKHPETWSAAQHRAWDAKSKRRSEDPSIGKAEYAARREAQLAQKKAEYHSRTPEQHRAMRLAKYGLTPAAFDAMLAGQGGRCAICGTDEPGWHGWNVDHDHETGVVRGILCGHCNVGLGHFADDADRLRAAADYLDRGKTEPKALTRPDLRPTTEEPTGLGGWKAKK
jgi:hypothetical protein